MLGYCGSMEEMLYPELIEYRLKILLEPCHLRYD
jgi:hypothetical protein